MSTLPATTKLLDDLEAALRLDRPAPVRAARVSALVDAAARTGGTAIQFGAGDRNASAVRNIFWRVVAEVNRVAGSRASHDGIIAALSAAIEEARDDLKELQDLSRGSQAT